MKNLSRIMQLSLGLFFIAMFACSAVRAEDMSNVSTAATDAINYADQAVNAQTLDDAKGFATKAQQSANDAEEAAGDSEAGKFASDAADYAGKATLATTLKEAQDFSKMAKDAAQSAKSAAEADR